MSNEALATIASLLGLVALGEGTLLITGKWRSWQRLYWNRSLPEFQRNGVFGLLPGGVVILLGVLGAALEAAGLDPIGLWVMVAALLAFLTLVPYFMARPPAWLKPRWLRELEAQAARDPELLRKLTEQTRFVLSTRAYRANWIILVAALAAWFLFSWSPAVLIGIGIGAGLLFGSRPRAG